MAVVNIPRSIGPDMTNDPSPSRAPHPAPLLRAAHSIGACAVRTLSLIARRRLHQPVENAGRMIRFADGSQAAVYRETVVSGTEPAAPVVLVVGFRLRHVRRAWAHRVFR